MRCKSWVITATVSNSLLTKRTSILVELLSSLINIEHVKRSQNELDLGMGVRTVLVQSSAHHPRMPRRRL